MLFFNPKEVITESSYKLLESLDINICLTFYMEGIISNFRVKDGKPVMSNGVNHRSMGMSFQDDYGWITSHSDVTLYKKFQIEDDIYGYRPIVSHYIGYVDCHELTMIGNIPVINATLFDRLITYHPDFDKDFQVLYKPDFAIDKLEPKDHHHMNGICLKNGKIKYITAFTNVTNDKKKGWKENPNTGVVWECMTEKPFLTGLNLPHSPRIFDNDFYVCNSGDGELIKVDSTGKKSILELGNFIRGMERYDNYLFIAGSKVRNTSKHVNYNKVITNDCCLFIVDISKFELVGRIDFNDIFDQEVREVFDLTIMPSNTLIVPSISEGYKFTHFV